MNRRRFLRYGVAAFASILVPRVLADPRALQRTTDVCPYCNMPVIDGRFAAQVITSGGLTLTYDAIECLLDHEAGHGPPPPNAIERWLADRKHSQREAVVWLEAETEATLLHHARLRTPMGGGLAAFHSLDEARMFVETNRLSGAQTLSWSEARSLASERPWVPTW